MSSGEAPIQRRSSEIVAAAQELKQKYNKKDADRARRHAKKRKDDDKKDLKAELTLVEHQMSVDELSAHLSTDSERGMTTEMVTARQNSEGRNALTPPKSKPEWRKVVDELTGFFALLLWAGAILCFVGYGLQQAQDNLYLGIVLAVVVVITGLFSYYQNRKSSELMESFKSMMPTMCTVVRDGDTLQINALELVRGDLVEVRAGDKIPADLRIISASDDMEVDNSSLTGESEPQKRGPDCTHENPLETKNLAFFGTQVPKGRARGLVINIGDNTVMGRIARLTSSEEATQTPIAREIDRFVHIVSAVAIALGVGFFIVGIVIGTDWITNLVFMIGIIVANVPEGLLATVTVCLALTANRMATKSVLVKNMQGVETLGSTSCICSDKTGTLTQNIMTVVNLVYDQQIWTAASSMGQSNLDMSRESFRRLQRCATLCNTTKWDKASQFETRYEGGKKIIDETKPVPFARDVLLGDGSTDRRVMWKPLGDASESALIKFCQPIQDITELRSQYAKFTEIPFNSANKYQVSVHAQPGSARLLLQMKGAPERIINRCNKIYMNDRIVDFTDELRQQVEALQLRMSKNGLRVLGFAELEMPEEYTSEYRFNTDNPNFPLGEAWRDPSALPLNADGSRPDPRVATPLVFLGLFALIDPPRPQVPDAVRRCKTAGIRVIMVTGDHPVTAKAISQKVGIIWSETREDIEEANTEAGLAPGDAGWRDPDLAEAIVVPGWDISVDTPEEVWDDILAHNQVVFARTSPQQKLLIVENNQRRGDVVAVTGDGVNDAPALRKADIGVAMGIQGTEVSKEAADMILLDDNFASIVAGVEEGRLIFDNLKKSIAYTLSSNIPEIAPFISFILVQLPLPLSTVLILCVDLGTDMVPAISMAWEYAESDIMRRPPRDSQEDHLVTRKLVCFAYLQIGIIQAFAGFFTYFVVLNDYGYAPGMLSGLGAYDNWGKQPLFCKEEANKFGELVNLAGDVFVSTHAKGMPQYYAEARTNGFLFWKQTADAVLESCVYPARDYKASGNTGSLTIADAATFLTGTNVGTANQWVITSKSIEALADARYFEYIPLKARESEFWRSVWVAGSMPMDDVPGLSSSSVNGLIYFSHQLPGSLTPTATSPTGGDTVLGLTAATDAFNTKFGSRNSWTGAFTFTQTANGQINVGSRMAQKEALHHAQSSYFVAIVVVQWADLVICKTRLNSLYHQGMRNPAMNFGLIFETVLAGYLCYLPGLGSALGTRPLRLLHWTPAVPFAIVIVMYDEVRKYLMRRTTRVTADKTTGQIYRDSGWIERFTYY